AGAPRRRNRKGPHRPHTSPVVGCDTSRPRGSSRRARPAATLAGIVTATCLTGLLASCGDTASIEEATTAPPLTAQRVDITLTGDAGVTIPDPSHDVSFRLDDAHLLAVDLRVHSEG